MNIISLTMVGNENEIIESFIRYNFNFVDKMLIVSTCCIDNTLTIIRKLIKEGFNIELIEEVDIAFEQRYLDNKYLKRIAKREKADLVIPLDADEFITGTDNPREILETLTLDSVYSVKWENYAMRPEDDWDEAYIPKRLRHVKKNFEGNLIEKVFFPSNLILKNKITLETGHHTAFGEGIKIKKLKNLWLAHFPSISKEQYLLRIYESSIKYITWRKRAFDEGFHIYQQIMRIEQDEDVFAVANGYGLKEKGEILLEEKPLNLNYCETDSMIIKYSSLSKTCVFESIRKVGQLMALKAYNLELNQELDQKKPTVLIYGIGHGAKRLMNGIPEDIVNIRAYIDNDKLKQFRMYRKRLVIPPDYIRFFQFEKIIITSQAYYDEMKKILISIGINKEQISSERYLFDILEERLNNSNG